jgi:hypothetical protein
MNPSDWPIKHRANACAATQRPFVEGEHFYTLLFRDGDGYRREDLSEDAWQQRNENIQPFSFWRTRFELPPADPPETLGKQTAEQLFRRLLEQEDAPANALYVLAAMLERKRLLKQVRTEVNGADRVLVYEDRGSGDVFVVRDPQLHLDELEQVQTEVSELLKNAAPA